MSDRLEHLIESNAKAILALTNQGVELNNKIDRINTELNNKIDRVNTELNSKIDRTSAIVAELANIVYAVSNRQEDQEHRITRLEDRL